MPSPFVLRFDEISIGDIPRAGGKNASLGEMFRELSTQGVKVPPGFAITVEAYRYFLCENGLDVRIPELLAELDTRDVDNLRERGHRVRQAILQADLPNSLQRTLLHYGNSLKSASCRSAGTTDTRSEAKESLPLRVSPVPRRR